jgi:hypothetical protein
MEFFANISIKDLLDIESNPSLTFVSLLSKIVALLSSFLFFSFPFYIRTPYLVMLASFVPFCSKDE